MSRLRTDKRLANSRVRSVKRFFFPLGTMWHNFLELLAHGKINNLISPANPTTTETNVFCFSIFSDIPDAAKHMGISTIVSTWSWNSLYRIFIPPKIYPQPASHEACMEFESTQIFFLYGKIKTVGIVNGLWYSLLILIYMISIY